MDFLFRLFTAVPRSQVFPPWPPWLRRPPVEPRSLVGSSGGRTLVDRGARGGPGAEPGSLAEQAGNDQACAESAPPTRTSISCPHPT